MYFQIYALLRSLWKRCQKCLRGGSQGSDELCPEAAGNEGLFGDPWVTAIFRFIGHKMFIVSADASFFLV